MLSIIILCLIWSFAFCEDHLIIDFQKITKEVKPLPRFWTNSGFSPPAPIDDVDAFFDSEDVQTNLEIIGSLPNQGISHLRIHWLLNLLKIKDFSRYDFPVYDFEKLDKFMLHLMRSGLAPTLEFMTTLKFKRKKIENYIWEDLAFQVIGRYVEQFGLEKVKKWKFETWNEPDLKGYNLLKFSVSDYIEYITGIERGLRAAERLFSLNKTFLLTGPSGLFKDEDKHMLCWGLLEMCDENPPNCPIDQITFHSKGNGRKAEEILNGGIHLIESIMWKFPMLGGKKYSNTEADPIKKWSEPREFQSDIRYAVILSATVSVLGLWVVGLYTKLVGPINF